MTSMQHLIPASAGAESAGGTGAARANTAELDEAGLYARFFRVLGDPTRIRLLHLLLESPSGEYSVGELTAALDAPQSRISTHLGCLRWCGLVQARRAGKLVYYRVADTRVRELLAQGGAGRGDHAAGGAGGGADGERGSAGAG